MEIRPQRRPWDRVIRKPRREQLGPTIIQAVPLRRPHRIFSSPFILFFGFVALIIAGGFLLSLPISSNERVFTPLDLSFFTAVSAFTVTGHTVVNTATYWSLFGHAVIFFLLLIGGLSFMTLATFIFDFLRQRSSLSERLVLRESMGVDRMAGLRQTIRNIVVVASLIYLIGAAAIFWRIHGLDGMSFSESAWQSVFLSVSAFNNAGFSILPEDSPGSGLARLADQELLLFILMGLIALGGIGWTVLGDIYHHRSFTHLSLDTKLVIVASVFLWVAGLLVLFLAEFGNDQTLGNLSIVGRLVNSLFHSVSGRTAGLQTIDFGQASDFTKLTYPAFMFIGGGAGSVAGGIKVNTLAVIMVAVISAMRGRQQAEAFGREIAFRQVMRALAVGMLSMALIFSVIPVLTITEPDLAFLDLLFETVSAFGTVGFSTGITSDLSLIGKIAFMITMLVGRLGPLTLALVLAPQRQLSYSFMREPVSIG